MKWEKGYSSEYYITVVDPSSWRDIQRIEITGGSINRERGGLMQSASINAVNYPQLIEQWIRVWLDTRQTGANGHEPLFTGLATSPTQAWNGPRHEDALTVYSVLQPAEKVDLLLGWYAPAGASGASVIKNLLSVTPAPVIVADNSPTLSEHIVAEAGENHLTMVEKILTAIDWRLRITGDGIISVEPKDKTPVYTMDPLENDVIETQINVTSDLFNCPNVFMAIQDDITAIARNDTGGPLSIAERGREVWASETGVTLADNETIEQYAQRRLDEEQQTQVRASYARRYLPGILPGDYIRLHYPEQGLQGDYMVDTQSVELSHEARTSEEVIA